ncbi:MAG TPA: DUF6259 domain-containing protein [Thermoguttaceae bacterium]|nr:DUF6259 domain-containing protein [Thermoguttaceae bacterium]
MKATAALSLILVVAVLSAPAASATTWDFETWDSVKDAAAWQEPEGGGVVAEPEAPGNHAYQIVATKVGHTSLVLAGSDASPDFVASVRFKALSSEGEPPTVFVYGRHGQDGFRGVQVNGDSAGGFFWYNQGKVSGTLPGSVGVPVGKGWLHAKLACYGDLVFVKCWPEGQAEPRWQISGELAGHEKGTFGVGVWLSPAAPSKARFLFDDVTFQPISEADLAALHLRVGPRPPLDPAEVSFREGEFETATDVGLATPSTIIAFDRQTGELTHLVHRASGQEFVSSQGAIRPLFDLTLTKPYEAKSTGVSAMDFRKVTVSKPQPSKLELTFTEHVSMPLSVRVSATAGAEGLVRLRIAVRNPTDWAVSRTQFPQFAAPARLGKEIADDRLLAPGSLGDNVLIDAPGSHTRWRRGLYPESMSVQFAALYDATAGLYLATHDADGHYKQWDVVMRKDRPVEMRLAHLSPEVPAREVELPYDVVLGAFVGDWRDAADVYKRWAKEQPWCARRVSQRGDIPEFLKEGAALLCVPFMHEKPEYALFPFEDVAKLPQIAAAYQERTQLPHIGFAPFGWENRGAWAGINYFPARPSNEVWQKVNAALREQGNYTCALPSGFSWVVKRRETRSGPAFDDTADFERRKGMTVQNADGAPWSLDDYGSARTWRGLSVKLCHGSQAARETALEVFLGIARLGTSLVQFDQEIGGGQRVPCYSKTHGHPPGFGNWMWTDFRDLCAEVREQGKSIRPEFGLSIEGCAELTIPYMATQWGRQCAEVDASQTGARSVGLFSYLYHEYIPVLGDGFSMGQGMSHTCGSAELRCYRLANTLARGLIPTVYMEQVPLEPKDEWGRTVSQAFFSYCRPYAGFPEYLLLGATRRPPEIECAEQGLWHFQADEQGEKLPDGRTARKVTIRRPTVVAGSFEAEDGSIGTVIVNATPDPQQAKVRLASSGRCAALFHADRTEAQRWDKCPTEIAVSLEPFGVRMLIVR